MSIKLLMGIGYMMVAEGYLIFAFSFSFWSVAVGFIILGYFNAFSNRGQTARTSPNGSSNIQWGKVKRLPTK